MAKVTRREAREIALKVLFSYEFNGSQDIGVFFDETCDSFELPKDDFAYEIFAKTIQDIPQEDEYIVKYSQGWNIDRIAKIVLCILRMCICEFIEFDDIPKRVSMNEYIELTKKYDLPSVAFVNGIVNNVGKEILKK